MIRYWILGAAALCITACTDKAAQPHPVITAHVAAFNSKDLTAMQAQEHADIEWLTVNKSNMTSEVSGRDELAKNMADMFQSDTVVTGTLRDWSVNGNYIAVTETAHWANDKSEPKSQSALTVYEMEDDLIRRVYYYPAVSN